MGRAPTGKYKIADMIETIDIYTDSEELPILKEVCYKNYWDYSYLMKLQKRHENLRQAVKRLLDKKEAQLEKETFNGKLNSQMAIFSLRQLGWKNEPEVEKEQEKLEIIFKYPKSIEITEGEDLEEENEK